MYNIYNFRHNGECQFQFDMHSIPNRPLSNGGVTIKAKPDATLCISQEENNYPYCVVEVMKSLILFWFTVCVYGLLNCNLCHSVGRT